MCSTWEAPNQKEAESKLFGVLFVFLQECVVLCLVDIILFELNICHALVALSHSGFLTRNLLHSGTAVLSACLAPITFSILFFLNAVWEVQGKKFASDVKFNAGP